ncbi:MAG: fused MFS/spermidine synthase, partial [Flavobacteriales bacterium]|nr:fused MFS/spermidine synthase [Flavobacteriales bacterium]
QIMILVLFVASLLLSFFVGSNLQTLYSSNGILGHVEVIDVEKNGGSLRRLVVDGIIQTEIEMASGVATMPYLQKMDSIFNAESFHSKKALLIGLGGGILANNLVRAGYNVESVELDGRISEAATKYFSLSDEVKVVVNDGRKFINESKSVYDLIVLDVFHGEVQPSHVISYESFKKVKEMLTDSGKLVLNWHGYTEGSLGKGTKILSNTLEYAGLTPELLFTGPNPDYRNTILLCDKNASMNELVENELVNTDEKPIIETANAQANLRWRINYHNYYRFRTQ